MPIFYFDVEQENASTPDLEGTELPDAATALHEARRALGDLGKEALMSSPLPADIGMEIRVRDTAGTVLFRLRGRFDLVSGHSAPISTSTQGQR